MKRLILIIAASFIAAAPLSAQNLQALFSYKTFYSPENGPYIETYLSVNANTVKYSKNESGKFQGAITIGFSFTDESGAVKHSDRYNLLSPEVADTAGIEFYFLDQQRVQLPNGTYKIDLEIADKNIPEKPYKISDAVKLEFYNNIIAVSDIEFVDKYSKTVTPSIISKSGYDLVPYVDNFFPANVKTLKFYCEVYNTNVVFDTLSYLVTYYFESAESKRIIENLRGFSKQKASNVNVLLREIPLSDLPSGNYNLVVEVRNRENELVAQNSVYLQRSNRMSLPDATTDFTQLDISNTFASYITGTEVLKEHINSLYPIASPLEKTFINNQLKLADEKIMQQFFYDFWAKRSPVNPEKAWIDYHQEVLKVNNEYSTPIKRGHATDRGRVYLQYGPPNTITKSYNEVSAYPYEVWHYYKIGTQSNRKFVFYNPDLVTNDFTLIHSDAQGEPFNNQWQLVIYKRDTQSIDYDTENKGDDYFGNKAEENFNNPK